ncbi:MAG: NnrS family protein [Planctomycetes bacterium]|nr:NnrS family protein [Planctomycetota bacterium]
MPTRVCRLPRPHAVPAERLRQPAEQSAPDEANKPWAEDAYKWFFALGVLIALTGGAVLGTWFMYTMGSTGSYFAPGIHRMNAHAFAMIYGFVGAFVMGFGYQALPRFKQTVVRDPKLAPLSLVLLLSGVGLRFFGEFFGHGESGNALVNHLPGASAALLGTGLTFAAFVVFSVALLRTYRAAGKPFEAYDWWILGSLFWFNVSLLMSGAYYALLFASDGFSELVARVSMLQDALRNVQLFGAITMIVLGVMLRFLPPVFGFAAPDKRRYMRMFWLVNAGLVLMVIAFPLSMATKRGLIGAESATTALRGVYFLGAIAMSGGLIGALAGFRPWARPGSTDRSVKFARVAQLWLALSLLMLLLEPVYVIGILKTFGHGYHGGMRHALTLGFVVMMIVAVSTRVVPTLKGINTEKLSRLRVLFVLLNVAIAARVVAEIAGDFSKGALPALAPTGALLLVALLLWGVHLLRIVHGCAVRESETVIAKQEQGASHA